MRSIFINKTTQIVMGFFVVVIGLALLACSTHAATFTVNTTDDGNDVNPGDGVCEVNVGQDDCGLRALIEETNTLGGADVGNFNIPGAGVQTFTPGSAYPSITDQLTIDGSTQPGASCGTLVPASLPAGSNTPHNLLIEVDGTGIGNLLTLTADNITIRGMIVRSASSNIVSPPGNPITGTTIECNYIGTNSTGNGSSGSSTGIFLYQNSAYTIQNNLIAGNSSLGVNTYGSDGNFSNNLVGTNATGISSVANENGAYFNEDGTSTYNHNVFSGNTGYGLQISNSNNATITANYAGLGIDGSVVGNGGDGLVIFGTSNFTVGGAANGDRNIASGNGGAGLHIYNNCSGFGSAVSTVFNNYLGTNTSGAMQSGYGNGGSGIEVNEFYGGCVSVYKHQIGGDNPGEPNTIVGNGADGIQIHQSELHDVFSISLISNIIYGNGNLGINLAADSDGNSGIADTDLGPNPLNALSINYPTTVANYYLNHPVINSNSVSGNDITINYSFTAPTVVENFPYLLASNLVGYRLDFYINDGQDGAYAGYNQGKTHLGSFIVNGSETNATHTFTSPIALSSGQSVNATATVLWQIIGICNGTQVGDGPPYDYCGPN